MTPPLVEVAAGISGPKPFAREARDLDLDITRFVMRFTMDPDWDILLRLRDWGAGKGGGATAAV